MDVEWLFIIFIIKSEVFGYIFEEGKNVIFGFRVGVMFGFIFLGLLVYRRGIEILEMIILLKESMGVGVGGQKWFKNEILGNINILRELDKMSW